MTLEQKEDVKSDPCFTKEQLLESRKYKSRRDLLNAILQEDKTYTLKQVDGLIKKFMKGKVE